MRVESSQSVRAEGLETGAAIVPDDGTVVADRLKGLEGRVEGDVVGKCSSVVLYNTILNVLQCWSASSKLQSTSLTH